MYKLNIRLQSYFFRGGSGGEFINVGREIDDNLEVNQ